MNFDFVKVQNGIVLHQNLHEPSSKGLFTRNQSVGCTERAVDVPTEETAAVLVLEQFIHSFGNCYNHVSRSHTYPLVCIYKSRQSTAAMFIHLNYQSVHNSRYQEILHCYSLQWITAGYNNGKYSARE